MTGRIAIKATEHGVVRVFTVDLPPSELEGFNTRNGSWPLLEALGADTLDASQIELFPLSDLAEMGLAGYLEEGLGIPKDQINELRPQLAAMKGAVLILRSPAFGGVEQVLAPRAPLRLVGTFTEENATVSFVPLPKASAQGQVGASGKKAPSNAAISGRIAMFALLVLFALVGVMVWVAS
ncbi:hypothetical protein PEL8287_03203 [Roseovarius litorisediminis]|uniref:Aspartate carbamoyltransferase catalytic subunit n=1 Tax=Roseovarius litorisediminis TaxID=1312363 RepID=A0A1Y5TAH5_9RHOB|nr:hypothetical protein [Roseovarius litorisediminis]SLN59284.1 hypothetical protein PEL8287_03203 [Roseovarius litorisediminis]